jgi:4-diphosphocytidyl-2-C-methyl-D-erythritol kinase
MLGADCAFFIKNAPVFAEGTGNIFSPISLSLKGYGLVIIKPDIFISTRDAFSRICPRKPEHSLKEISAYPINEWKEQMQNDFEESVFLQYPITGKIKTELYRQGATYAALSGSGASVFGLFHPNIPVPKIKLENSFCFQCVIE